MIVMTSPVTQRDSHLKDAVIAELAWTPNVNASKIGVAVIDGAVTLAGEVLTYPEREQAEWAALRVRGVTAIADEIEVHVPGDTPSDSDIARQAGEMLDRAVDVPEGSVKAAVHRRVVTFPARSTGSTNGAPRTARWPTSKG